MKRRFLVTCATGDIGSELCLYLAKKGHDLIITGRKIEKLQNLTTKITTKYPERKVDFCCADLGRPESMNELIALSKARGIDGIVLMPPRPPILPKDHLLQFETLIKAMQECFAGPRYLLQQVLPSLESSTLKSVVLISGASSKQPISNPEYEAFNDIRTAWVGCIKSFAETYGPLGIRFNTVSPGQIVTPTYIKKLETEEPTKIYTEVLRERASAVPLRKFASLRGVIRFIYIMLKSSGSSEITSANVQIDGGAGRSYY